MVFASMKVVKPKEFPPNDKYAVPFGTNTSPLSLVLPLGELRSKQVAYPASPGQVPTA